MLDALKRDPGHCFLTTMDAKQKISERLPFFFQMSRVSTGYKQTGVEHLSGFRELLTAHVKKPKGKVKGKYDFSRFIIKICIMRRHQFELFYNSTQLASHKFSSDETQSHGPH